MMSNYPSAASMQDDAALPSRLHGTGFSTGEMLAAMEWQQRQTQMQHWALMQSPVAHVVQQRILQTLNTSQNEVYGPNQTRGQAIQGAISMGAGMLAANMFHSPTALLYGMQQAAAGGMRISGPGGTTLGIGPGAFQEHVTRELFAQTMSQTPFGLHGFGNQRIGGELLPMLAGRGMFRGMQVGFDGERVDQATLRNMSGILDDSTSMLRILGDVFNTDDVKFLLSEAERITGQVANSRQAMESMAGKLRRVRDTAMAAGLNPIAAMNMVDAGNQVMASSMVMRGVHIEDAMRLSGALGTERFAGVAAAHAGYEAARAGGNGYMPARSLADFDRAASSQMAKVLGSNQGRAWMGMQKLLESGTNLTEAQRGRLEAMQASYAAAEDKRAWAREADKMLREEFGTSARELLRDDPTLSDAGMARMKAQMLAHSPDLGSAGQLATRASRMGVFKRSGIEFNRETHDRMTNLGNTLFGGLSITDARRFLAAQAGGTGMDFLRTAKLDKFFSEQDMAALTSLSKADTDVLTGMNALRGVSRDILETPSRQDMTELRQKQAAATVQRLIGGNESPASGGSFLMQLFKGFAGYVDPNELNIKSHIFGMRRGTGTMLTRLNQAGGLDIDDKQAGRLLEMFTKAGGSLDELGIKDQAGLASLVSSQEGMAAFAEAAMGAGMMAQGGITGLERKLSQADISVGPDGALQGKDIAAALKNMGLDPRTLSRLDSPGGMARLKTGLLQSSRGKELLRDDSIAWLSEDAVSAARSAIERHNVSWVAKGGERTGAEVLKHADDGQAVANKAGSSSAPLKHSEVSNMTVTNLTILNKPGGMFD